MKIKKALPVVLSLALLGGLTAGCAHTHEYATAYTSAGEGGHYHVATCHPEEHDTIVSHTYDNDADTTCNDCDYVRTLTPATPSTTTPETPTENEEEIVYSALPADKKIYVVGDSTVCSFSDKYYLPRYGYGTQLAEYLNVTSDQIVNLALSGRSSKSFLTETQYTTLTTSITTGDYLIIGFGHNDEKNAEPARFTDPAGTYTQATTAKGTSFQYCLYENYVKMAADKGATPILCTPITRYDASGAYTGSKVHNTSDGDYAASIKTLGEATDTTVIDLTTLTKELYKTDNDEAKYFHAHTTYAGDKVATITGEETPEGKDDTHINKYGAKMVAYQFATALKKTNCPLRNHVKESIAAPTKAVDYLDAVNKEYDKPLYKAFVPADNAARKLTGDWYKTVMGNIGGTKNGNYSITYDTANSTFEVGNPTSKDNGKFESAGDGFGAAFMQISKAKNFTISADIKVKAMGEKTNNQAAFGIMLRDDIWLDGGEGYTGKETITSNFVAAGVFAKTNGAIFSRKDTELQFEKNNLVPAINSTYKASIERVGQTVTVKFGTFTKVYTDFDFVAIDNDNMYICLFANRGFEVSFSNVQFEITGDAQGA